MWQRKLLNWYQKHKRDLPWRHTKDPYKIWVSEIMLQQTTVETVIPYYENFLKRFPTIQSLAEAPEDDVLKMWSGLGYYSRARNLQKAAQMICRGNPPWLPSMGSNLGQARRPAPTLPSTIEELIQLPGIGRYTAGAIASIAFNQPAPILDGNVMRVLSRLYKMSENPKTPQGQKIFWTKSVGAIHELPLQPKPNYGDFNQALMELGATVCKPTSPLCKTCPIASHCQAYKEGCAIDFPKLPKRVESVSVQVSAAVIEKSGKVLMTRRGDRGLLKNMWEFPMVEGSVEELLKKIGLMGPISPIGPIKHSVLNRRLTITAYHHTLKKSYSPKQEHQWILPKNIHEIPTSSMNKKILKAFLS
ncbi:MAG: A/G-specific adenine glycosylase [Deltaproteobacteria bacterium]|nr:MAG: A/G-specific adenine glycosylase [Deltaproteobacteria bacterium]